MHVQNPSKRMSLRCLCLSRQVTKDLSKSFAKVLIFLVVPFT
jgi:hypothetical protein